MPTVTRETASIIGLIVAPLIFALAAYFTRAGARRIAGALAGALTYAVANYAWDQIALVRGWWSYPGWGADGRFPPGMYVLAGLVAGGAGCLLGWRVVRRYGAPGLIAFLIAWTAWGFLHDMAGSRVFASSSLMVISQGIVPAVADAALYASCWLLAYLVMGLVAGTVNGDALARRHPAARAR